MSQGKKQKIETQRGFNLFYLLLAVFSGVLYQLADFPIPVTPLMFFSMIPLMYVLYTSKPLPTLIYTFVTYLVWSTWMYNNVTIAIPWTVAVGFVLIVITMYTILGCITSWLAPRIHPFL